MTMTKLVLTAHQPGYLPWLGLFHKIALADLYCVFDVAQYQTKEFDNRNRIKTPNGPLWLSVPVESKGHFQKTIGDIPIVHDGWNKKHVRSLQMAYGKAPYFKDYMGEIEAILMQGHARLSDLNVALLKTFLKWLAIDVPVVRASDYDLQGAKSDLVLDMCLKLKASDYIFGAQGKDYADIPSFLKAGVTPYFQAYSHPTYRQVGGGDFLPYMSVLDLLFNAGSESRDIIMRGNAASLAELGQQGAVSS